MNKLQQILDLWIEKGAVYEGGELKDLKVYTCTFGIDGDKTRVAFEFVYENKKYLELNVYQILYNPTSNFREVMFPGEEVIKYGDIRFTQLEQVERRQDRYKMQSTLRENPIDELHSLLFKKDRGLT